ncbi:uncharacterized protein LOC106760218 [Vigna radiata var. radiata]|uniref:Uncharacterized protein LOC106760218 n=1 Tax=Vigna radiata var. radiata TaxID=3916 RepID=A0A1S3TZG6_VIGRR|nr:uncharacterized protein LOC106760218 [Vigna radiata var. radiata]
MAATSVSSIQIPIHRYGSFLNCPNKKFISKPSYIPLKRASSSVVRIAASMKNKVYEDRSEGIVCYQDERGEIICEGYDEGPCFQRIPDLTNNHPREREAQITNLLLRQSWLQIVKGEKNSNDGAVEEGRVRKDFNCNGFNSLC